MPQILPPGFGHVTHSLSLIEDPEPMAITYGVSFDSVGPPGFPATVSGLHNAFFTAMGNDISSRYTLRATEVKYVAGDNPNPQVEIFLQDNLFTGSIDTLPQNSSFLIQKRSSSAGRRNRGRMYLPGVPESIVGNAGVLTPAYVTQMNTALSGWLSAIQALGDVQNMVILHSFASVPPVPLPPTIVSQLVCDTRIATQRLRLRR